MKRTMSQHPLWRRWGQIRYQITNENSPNHDKYYKGLPMIGLNNFWEFAEFVEREIGPLPSPEYKLARKNQRAGYVRGNIFWAESNREVGQRFSKIYKYKIGRKTMTLREMSEVSGFNENTIRCRMARGWSARDAITIPPTLGQKIYGSL